MITLNLKELLLINIFVYSVCTIVDIFYFNKNEGGMPSLELFFLSLQF